MLGERRLITVSALMLAVLSALLLIAARPAHAQTESVLYNFTGGSDGGNPYSSLTSDGKGNFYGTTGGGGTSNVGTVFELSPSGSGGWNETVLYSFCSVGKYPNCTDGWDPASNVIFDGNGNILGTTVYGGAYGTGVVFELSLTGTNWTETVLHSCTYYPDCANPISGLIFDLTGNLYGSSEIGVFELSPSGDGWTGQLIYNEVDYVAGLTMDAAGNIFGTSTYYDVFELSPNGSGGWNPTVIYTYRGSRSRKDKIGAYGTPVLDPAGNLYGTTYGGGKFNYGTVYKLSRGEDGAWTNKVLYSFNGGTEDGSRPFAGVVLDASGNIYGTTSAGGAFGYGSVFELVAPAGKHKTYTEKVLWNFNGTDGYRPNDSLVLDSVGNLYGATVFGGSSWEPDNFGYGVVFEVTP